MPANVSGTVGPSFTNSLPHPINTENVDGDSIRQLALAAANQDAFLNSMGVKARGRVKPDGTNTGTLVGGFNIASVTLNNNGGADMHVTFTTPIASTNYIVLATPCGVAGSVASSPDYVVFAQTVNGFKVQSYDAAGNPINWVAVLASEFGFAVLGG